MTRIVLIDADIDLYQIAQKNEVEVQWDEDTITMTTDIANAKHVFDETIKGIVKKLDADDYILCMTGDNNFRRTHFPTYKANRKDRKPMGYKLLKQHAIENHPHKIYDTLEADDVMGILATKKAPAGTEYVIHSADKDMKTIPAKVWDEKQKKIVNISQLEADRFLYTQLLTGDAVDGYKGCPSVGKVKAQQALAPCSTELEMRNAVLKLYLKAYKAEGEDYAKQAMIETAGQARILRACDYDFKTKSVIIWHPWRDNGHIEERSEVPAAHSQAAQAQAS